MEFWGTSENGLQASTSQSQLAQMTTSQIINWFSLHPDGI